MWRGATIGVLVGLVMAAIVIVVGQNELTVTLNLPAFVAAAIIGGNIHNPSPVAFAVAVVAQWTLLGLAGGGLVLLWKRFGAARGQSAHDV